MASEPDIEGQLVIEAAMDTTSAAVVQLYAPENRPVPFTAWLSPDTPLSFDIRPAKGMLAPRPGSAKAEGSGGDLAVTDRRQSQAALNRQSHAGSSPPRTGRSRSPSPTQRGTGRGGNPEARAGSGEAGAPALVVTYTCRDFGKIVKGKLFVQTEEATYR